MNDANFGFTHREKQFLQRKEDKLEDWKGAIVILWVITLLTLFIHFFIEPHPAKAETRGPMTNKEVCEALKEGDYRIPAGQITNTVKLCAKLGITI